MNKGLEALERMYEHGEWDFSMDMEYDVEIDRDIIEKELKDFEWLKSKINFDFFYQLPSEDRIKLAEILGVEL